MVVCHEIRVRPQNNGLRTDSGTASWPFLMLVINRKITCPDMKVVNGASIASLRVQRQLESAKRVFSLA
jgi:hypothetical protein